MRYRTLDVRIWCDEKFRSLSPLKPSAQALFLYLLSNPHTTSIPGLYRAGAAAMAEELGWSTIGFNRALQEIVGQGLVKADLKARVIFIANAIKYNKPQSPNVIRSWALHWDEIPECSLKNEAYDTLKGFVQGLGKPFMQAFEEALCQARLRSTKQAIAELSANQDQEQDEDQEQDQQKSVYSIDAHSLIHLTDNNGTTYPLAIPLRHQGFYYVTQQECEAWQAVYKDIPVLQELHQLIAWNRANPSQRKQRTHIMRHVHAWLSKTQRQKTQTSLMQAKTPALTWDHNVQIAKNWLNECVAEQKIDQSCELSVLEGKK